MNEMNPSGTESKGCSPGSTVEPKKSARLAEKRKLREEAGTPVSEDDYYFTPFTKSANVSSKAGGGSIRQSTPSPSPKEKAGRSSSPFTTIPSLKSSSPVPVTAPRSPVTCSTSYFKSLSTLKSPSKQGTVEGQTVSSSSFVSKSSIPSYQAEAVGLRPIIETKDCKSPIKKPIEELSSVFTDIMKYHTSSSSAEEKWLDTLELGQDVCDTEDELKKDKIPRFINARQKDIILEKKDRDLVDYFNGGGLERAVEIVGTPAADTVEMNDSRAQKSEKRRLQAKKQKEKEKDETIDRILKLKKQHIKPANPCPTKPRKEDVDLKIVYINRLDRITITFPPGLEYPLRKTTVVPVPPAPIRCGVMGCTNLKKYACSKTKVPLCSLACYKTNLEESIQQEIRLETNDDWTDQRLAKSYMQISYLRLCSL